MSSKFQADSAAAAAFYRTIWRWHFYAGLFVMPFILVLSVTGAIYLFKPQLDRWQMRSFTGQTMIEAVLPSVQRDAALRAFPRARFDSYRLPDRPGDAPVIHIALPDGTMRDVFVAPQGRVLGSVDPETTISATAQHIHGTLLSGPVGAWLVELAGSWAIVMVLTGLYLWWPDRRGLAGVVWPRLGGGRRMFWRDLHAVTGFWVSGFALVLLVTALPWAGVWGDAFRVARTEMGWVKDRPDWKIGADGHAEHDHGAMAGMARGGESGDRLDLIVAIATAQTGLPHPIVVKPPGAPDRTGPTTAWTIKTEAQNRPLNVTMTYDGQTGRELSRRGQADKHPIDKAIAYGIAWHEGQLFGWVNQLIGLLTATALVTLMVSGFVLWRRRKPDNALGALPPLPARMRGVVAILLVLAALLPMLAASLILLWFVERLILPRLPRALRWLGVVPANG